MRSRWGTVVFGILYAAMCTGIGCQKRRSAPPPPPATPAPPKWPGVGQWGETRERVPDFALQQERRCPKVPAGDDLWREFASPRQMDALKDGLLVCRAEVSEEVRKLDGMGPDMEFSFEIADQPPILLWGPENHSSMYVNIARLTLRKGDQVKVRAWERDVFSNDFAGETTFTWDGAFPLHISSSGFTMDCRALTEEEARGHARDQIAELDMYQLRIEEADPTPAADSYFRHGTDISHIKGMFGKGTFRYSAGFLGWEHPAIQQRLARLTAAERAWPDRVAQAVAKLEREASSGDTPLAFRGKWSARLVDTRLDKAMCATCHTPEALAEWKGPAYTFEVRGPEPPKCASFGVDVLDQKNDLFVGHALAVLDGKPRHCWEDDSDKDAAARRDVRFVVTYQREPRPRLLYVKWQGEGRWLRPVPPQP